jgi:hypothetical protein
VLNVLSQLATKFRTRVGESLATVQKHSTPLEEATTSSVDALKATEAAAEFQKILDQPGVVLGDPIGAVARLQLARALTQAGDVTKAKSVYADLLTLWKDADADCILHSAFRCSSPPSNPDRAA